MALENHFLFPYKPFLDWDPQFFTPSELSASESPMSSQTSTGYLQDAVAEWTDQCKRRGVASSPTHDSTATTDELQDLLHAYFNYICMGFWGSNCYGDPTHDSTCMLQDNDIVPDDDDPLNVMLKAKAQMVTREPLASSSASSHEELLSSTDPHGKDLHQPRDAKPSLPAPKDKPLAKKKKAKVVVVHPFAVVKPGGVEGEVTLEDVNARVLMRPRRPVPHPVGEYAHGPCVSPDGPGLSGKAVVSLTRIQTQGRGTITIIRTKG
ncbi:hypothetical protein OPV22_011164 [Ensete ventricosum]|uniref:Protein XRI1 n=1 Tax=Ensete ventricosum TaxID=4639 RepID=A0AAV8RMS9_ENSVE|nr:hypothetical protein OPV22_011164 [Ensete ventricosum]